MPWTLITSTPIVIGSYLAGALLLIGGLGVVLLRSVRAAGVAFVGCLLMVAALAWLLDATAVAVVQVLVAVVAAAGLLLAGRRSVAQPPPSGKSDVRAFSGQLIPGAIAAAAVLAAMAAAVLRGTWPVSEPASGGTFGEYLVGGVVAILVLVAAGVGVLTLPSLQARPPRPVEAPATGRRKRGRR